MTGVPSESPPKPETPHPKGVKQGALLVGKPEPDISAGDRRRLRGATCRDGLRASRWKCFNPRAPYGARRQPNARQSSSICFNPRAPYGARHAKCPVRLLRRCVFQSTRPVRGATRTALDAAQSEMFQSTRPVRGATFKATHRRCRGFNPRAPYGARRVKLVACASCTAMFQSTRPVRGATANVSHRRARVSIHAPRTGRDRMDRSTGRR